MARPLTRQEGALGFLRRPDKNETRDKKNPGTGESSAPYGEEGETETTKPARKE